MADQLGKGKNRPGYEDQAWRRERRRARDAVNCAIRYGTIEAGPCRRQNTGHGECSGRIVAHHFRGYDKANALAVHWYCEHHHTQVHHELGDRSTYRTRANDMTAARWRELAKRLPFGKRIGGRTYVAVEALAELGELGAYLRRELAEHLADGWNVAKLDHERPACSLLRYRDPWSRAWPELEASRQVDLVAHQAGEVRRYGAAGSPPILHRAELLLAPDDPRRAPLARLTAQAEAAGLFADPKRIGTAGAWAKLLDAKGLRVVGLRLVAKAATAELVEHWLAKREAHEVQGWSTAIQRTTPSAPARYLLDQGLLVGRVLDYGCGRGDLVHAELDNLAQWDPHWLPVRPRGLFDSILCAYVLNVIDQDYVARVLADVSSLLKPGGKAYFAVRRDLDADHVEGRGTTQHHVELDLPQLVEREGAFAIYTLSKGAPTMDTAKKAADLAADLRLNSARHQLVELYKADPDNMMAAIAELVELATLPPTVLPEADYVPEVMQPDTTRVCKAVGEVEGERRQVLGIVLEPDVVDSQGDTYDAEAIEQTAHLYLTDFRNIGLQHKALINDRVRLLESWIAPIDMVIAGTNVKAGTWLIKVRVDDDEIWRQVKAGELTGFSIAGFARRESIGRS